MTSESPPWDACTPDPGDDSRSEKGPARSRKEQHAPASVTALHNSGSKRCVMPPLCSPAFKADPHSIHIQIDDGGRKQGQHLTENQAADNGDSQRPAKLRSGSCCQREGKAAEQGSQRCHRDWTEAQQACLVDCVARVLVFV